MDGNPAIGVVNTSTREDLLGDIESRFRENRGFTVATVNLDHIVKLRRDAAFRDAYARHSHVVADGNPIVWLHRLAGRPVRLVPGSELVEPLVALAARNGISVAMLGATQETLDRAADNLVAKNRALRIVARIAPSHGFDPSSEEADECLTRIEESGARLCLLALGAPKQEKLAIRGLERVPSCGFVSVGAGLDFIAGTQRRAPLWLRHLALEWFWRLASDHRRLARRYLNCALILPSLTASAVSYRINNSSRPA